MKYVHCYSFKNDINVPVTVFIKNTIRCKDCLSCFHLQFIYIRIKIYAAFIDHSKAFDLVDRTSLWRKIFSYDIKGKVFNVILDINGCILNAWI